MPGGAFSAPAMQKRYLHRDGILVHYQKRNYSTQLHGNSWYDAGGSMNTRTYIIVPTGHSYDTLYNLSDLINEFEMNMGMNEWMGNLRTRACP